MERLYEGIPKNITELTQHYNEIIGLTGEDVNREGLLKTPKRAAKAIDFLTSGYQMDAKGNIAIGNV
jgi:GTP cyclohydrolase I